MLDISSWFKVNQGEIMSHKLKVKTLNEKESLPIDVFLANFL